MTEPQVSSDHHGTSSSGAKRKGMGAALFAAVHKVFGASNVSKLLLHIPVNRRHEAVITISHEAQARLSDPVYGCVSTILALQQQVASLQGELDMVQTQLVNSRFAYANIFQQQQQPNINVALQPSYSNNSISASTNFMNMSCYLNPIGFDHHAMDTTPSSHSFEPLQLSLLSQDEDDEEESKIPQTFNHEIRKDKEGSDTSVGQPSTHLSATNFSPPKRDNQGSPIMENNGDGDRRTLEDYSLPRPRGNTASIVRPPIQANSSTTSATISIHGAFF
ncbi:Lateral organ boundary [Sesbania bispinosa]|nr:Lateral organ boundary [Sesbania bispinosa]